MRLSVMIAVAVVARFSLAAVFVVAGGTKLARRRAFAKAVADYHLLPAGLSWLVAELLPPAELVVGGLLFLGVALIPAATAAAVGLAVFTIAAALNLFRGRRIACGCFGLLEAPLSRFTVARDLAFVMAAILVILKPVHALALVAWGTRAPMSSSSAIALLTISLVLVVGAPLLQAELRVIGLSRRVGGGRA